MANRKALSRARHRELVRHQSHLMASTPQYHDLYIYEGATKTKSATTGLPVYVGGTKTLMAPRPRVLVGGAEAQTSGGQERVGDARVWHIRRTIFPLERLLEAHGFFLDDPEGDLYQILDGQIVEDGHDAYAVTLTRMSQPRP